MAIDIHERTETARCPRLDDAGLRTGVKTTGVPGPRQRVTGSIRRHRKQDQERSARAAGWFSGAIGAWEREGRINEREAETLRRKLDEPLFLAVLPHFGVHLSIGVILRFPIGSITRATYTLLNLLVATLRFVVRRIDRRSWRQAMSIHSPLVIIVAGMPGIGTFAYLASKPVRTNPLLLRIGLDSALVKLPFRLYERTGLRWLIARPERSATRATMVVRLPARVMLTAQSIVLSLGIVIGGMFALDVVSQTLTAVLDPDVPGWEQVTRILDLNSEASLGTWYQVIALMLLSALFAIVAFSSPSDGRSYNRHWLILAVLALGFSLDEQAMFHDLGGFANLRDRLGIPGILHHTWVVFGLMSAAAAALYYRRFILALPQVTRRLFIVGAALYISGEILIEALTGWYIDGVVKQDLVYQTMTSFEELLGMLGIWFAITAVLQYIQSNHAEIRVALMPRPPLLSESLEPVEPARSPAPEPLPAGAGTSGSLIGSGNPTVSR